MEYSDQDWIIATLGQAQVLAAQDAATFNQLVLIIETPAGVYRLSTELPATVRDRIVGLVTPAGDLYTYGGRA